MCKIFLLKCFCFNSLKPEKELYGDVVTDHLMPRRGNITGKGTVCSYRSLNATPWQYLLHIQKTKSCDFFNLVYSANTVTSPSLNIKLRNDSEFSQIFEELFVFVIGSPMSSFITGESRDPRASSLGSHFWHWELFDIINYSQNRLWASIIT